MYNGTQIITIKTKMTKFILMLTKYMYIAVEKGYYIQQIITFKNRSHVFLFPLILLLVFNSDLTFMIPTLLLIL